MCTPDSTWGSNFYTSSSFHLFLWKRVSTLVVCAIVKAHYVCHFFHHKFSSLSLFLFTNGRNNATYILFLMIELALVTRYEGCLPRNLLWYSSLDAQKKLYIFKIISEVELLRKMHFLVKRKFCIKEMHQFPNLSRFSLEKYFELSLNQTLKILISLRITSSAFLLLEINNFHLRFCWLRKN